MCIASVQRRGRGEWDRTPHEKYDHITREKIPYVQWLLSGRMKGRRMKGRSKEGGKDT